VFASGLNNPRGLKFGPDGALYVADFYNRIIGHYEVPLTHPGRDRESGRIWRIVYRGDGPHGTPAPRTDWTTAGIDELVKDLGHPNLTVRMHATNQLVERGGKEGRQSLLERLRQQRVAHHPERPRQLPPPARWLHCRPHVDSSNLATTSFTDPGSSYPTSSGAPAVPRRSRPQVAPTEHWQQLTLLIDWPEQLAYELLRPVVLFGRSPAERAKETGSAERTLRRKARRFDQIGMVSLFAEERPPSPEDRRALPPPLRQLIVDLKAEYPAFRLGEIAQICFVASGRRPSRHTIQRILATGPAPKQTWRRYPDWFSCGYWGFA